MYLRIDLIKRILGMRKTITALNRVLPVFMAFFAWTINSQAQVVPVQGDTIRLIHEHITDTVPMVEPLRIINHAPYFTLHADSVLEYNFEINKNPRDYYWYLSNAPVGLRMDRNSGRLYFKADKSYFNSGRLKYDIPYTIKLGVQSLLDPLEKVDTSTTIVFYNTEVIVSKLKPSTPPIIFAEEGDEIRFNMQCEGGTFPTENITMVSSMPIFGYSPVTNCGDEFIWTVPYDFIKEEDTATERRLNLTFIGSDKFYNKDSNLVQIRVRPGLDYPSEYQKHAQVTREVNEFIASLRRTFYALSTSVKRAKGVRTAFDITSSTTALAGTVVSSSASSDGAKNVGRILPSVGLTLVPVKEAVSPDKVQERNTAATVRTIARRLEYMVSENALIGERDPKVIEKTKRLQEEIKQARVQLVDLPLIDWDVNISQEDADRFFRDPKVNKSYRARPRN